MYRVNVWSIESHTWIHAIPFRSVLMYRGPIGHIWLDISLSLSLSWANIPFFVVNHLSHGPILALEDINISFFLAFFLSLARFLVGLAFGFVRLNYVQQITIHTYCRRYWEHGHDHIRRTKDIFILLKKHTFVILGKLLFVIPGFSLQAIIQKKSVF